MSQAIDIPSVRPLDVTCSSTSPQEKYIPVHRRRGRASQPRVSSSSPTPSSSSSSSSSSTASVYPSSEHHIPVYTRADLLMLAASPLSRLSPTGHAALTSIAPEILTSTTPPAKRNVRRRSVSKASRRKAGGKKGMSWVPTRTMPGLIQEEGRVTWRERILALP